METNKKYFNRLAGGAMLLAGAMAFAACSSDEDFADAVNPGAGATGETVKTQFSINVPAGNSANKRLAQDIVQGQTTPVFRGINSIYLVPFKQAPAVGIIGLTPLQLGAIQPNELGEGTGAKVYYDVELEEGVNNFLFYGEAIAEANAKAKDNGKLNATVSATVNDIKFELQPISTEGITNVERTTLLAALNEIAAATDGITAWKDSKSDLKNFYNSYIRLKAGSAASIKKALEDLKYGLENNTQATSESELKAAIIAAIDKAINTTNGTIKDCEYPRNLGLPDGAAQLAWDNDPLSPAFDYVSSENIGNLSYTDMNKFVYPSALYYWVNTPIKTSNSPQADKYATDWNTCLGLYENDNDSVSATTASVALKNPINYAVARMDVAAWFKAVSVTDNLGETVTIGDGNGITMDGILIGGQKNLKWDFNTPVDGTEYTIYDASVTSTKLGSSTVSTTQAYSLALQTAQATTVRFALELTNNTGKSFNGKDGIVPDGGRFYLVGELTPEPGTADNRVFYQDHITLAKVTINTLENAYNCIPDLRAPKLELGLSVDLIWQKGLEANVTID